MKWMWVQMLVALMSADWHQQQSPVPVLGLSMLKMTTRDDISSTWGNGRPVSALNHEHVTTAEPDSEKHTTNSNNGSLISGDLTTATRDIQMTSKDSLIVTEAPANVTKLPVDTDSVTSSLLHSSMAQHEMETTQTASNGTASGKDTQTEMGNITSTVEITTQVADEAIVTTSVIKIDHNVTKESTTLISGTSALTESPGSKSDVYSSVTPLEITTQHSLQELSTATLPLNSTIEMETSTSPYREEQSTSEHAEGSGEESEVGSTSQASSSSPADITITTAENEGTSDSGSMSQAAQIALGVGVSLGVLFLIGAGFLLYKRKFKKDRGYETLDDFGVFEGLQNPTYDGHYDL